MAADCVNGPFATADEMATKLSGKLLSDGTGASDYNEITTITGLTGTVQDYKRGPGDPSDPTTTTPGGYATIQITRKTSTTPATITYSYKSGFVTPTLTVVITNSDTTAIFCSGTTPYTTATIKAAP